jgi:hypothetical protein
MFGSSLPPVVCMSAHVLICVCLCIVVCNTYCFCFVFRRLEKPYVASFSGLLIFDSPSVFSNVDIMQVSAFSD